jgi:hypothetical protein
MDHQPDDRAQAIRLARDEVINRTWGVTQQFLAVNQVNIDASGQPTVAHVDDRRRAGHYYVYFAIRDEPYYFVVCVRSEAASRSIVSGVYMEAGVKAYLTIRSAELRPEEITARVGLVPHTVHARGDPRGRVVGRTWDDHFWRLEAQRGIPGSVEDKIASLLSVLEPVATKIASLKPACTVRVTTVFEGWGGDLGFGGFGFDALTIKRLADLGAELDFDLYAHGPLMPEDDVTT